MTVTAVGLVIVYAMNIWCAASDATRPMLTGKIWYETTEQVDGGTSVISGRSGMNRTLSTPFQRIKRDMSRWAARESLSRIWVIGGWMAYVIFLTLAWRSGCFSGFRWPGFYRFCPREDIYARSPFGRLKGPVLRCCSAGGLQFFSFVFAIWINSCPTLRPVCPARSTARAYNFPSPHSSAR